MNKPHACLQGGVKYRLDATMIRGIAATHFPPFGKSLMLFPEVEGKASDLAEVHLFTGVNGTGKTRLMSLFASLLGHHVPLQKRLKGMSDSMQVFVTDRPGITELADTWSMGTTHVSSGGIAWQRSQEVINWLRTVPAFAYNGTAYISDAQVGIMAPMARPDRGTCLSFARPENYSQRLLQGITNLKVQAGMEMLNPERVARAGRIISRLEKTLSEITGQPFIFLVSSYNQPDIRVVWGNSELPFDLLPDGLRAILSWMVDAVVMLDAWIEGKADPAATEAVFLLDEVESSLHPLWQRRILPAFQRLFPKAQIFVATHSPFVISSLNQGWIHPLTLQGGQVRVDQPIPASRGDSYVSVLEDIMGLREWYDPETEKLLADFREKRESAYKGDGKARGDAIELARQIGTRSMELEYMMGKELAQMDRQFGKIDQK